MEMYTKDMRLATLAVVAVTIAFCKAAIAELVPIAPTGDQPVRLLTDAQLDLMSLPTLEERIAALQADKKLDRKHQKLQSESLWRSSRPFTVTFKSTTGENGPWKVTVGKRPDLLDGTSWYYAVDQRDKKSGRKTYIPSDGKPITLTIPRPNLEIGERYYWQVSCRGRCKRCKNDHHCPEAKQTVASPITAFTTDGAAPRWITLEGRVTNIRDLGGRKGLGGRRVRQGLMYRGQGLNDNSVTGVKPGANRLMVEDVKFMTDVLGIKTDLDLRSAVELAGLNASPLGDRVKFVNHTSYAYRDCFNDTGKKVMAENFRLFLKKGNLPIYFHCIGGADRTGTLAYMLNGVLGVAKHELETDWESTFYPRIPDTHPDPNYWCRESHFNTCLAKYGKEGDSVCTRIELYLKDCGITDEEIAAFREIMLERSQGEDALPTGEKEPAKGDK